MYGRKMANLVALADSNFSTDFFATVLIPFGATFFFYFKERDIFTQSKENRIPPVHCQIPKR
jgi:hypothetical protein